MEEWRPVKGFPNYEVSNRGRLRNKDSGEIVEGIITRHGIKQHKLSKGRAVQITVAAHNLVAETFLPDTNRTYADDEHVIHKNDDKLDNRVENLEFKRGGPGRPRSDAYLWKNLDVD